MSWNDNRTNFVRNLAVVVGIDDYQNGIARLRTAVNDATTVADLLEHEYAYQVIHLLNQAAALQQLNKLLFDTLPNNIKLNEGDRLLIYFAGHGIARDGRDGLSGYLIPQDAHIGDFSTFLSIRSLMEALSKLCCHHLLLILDCCFINLNQWANARKLFRVSGQLYREQYDLLPRYPAWQVIASDTFVGEALDLFTDTRGQVFVEDSPHHSPFAMALIDGLLSRATQDNIITAPDLYLYLQRRISELPLEHQPPLPRFWSLRSEYSLGEYIFTTPGFKPENLRPAPPINESNNPYRGLAPFDEKYAHFFFGRDSLVNELGNCLLENNRPLIVILGNSGSGKSSLIKAGLIPSLRKRDWQGQWYILEPIRPGNSPFTSLARGILSIFNPTLLNQLAQISFIDKAILASSSNQDFTFPELELLWKDASPEAKLLLVVDYFPQLRSLCTSEEKKLLYEVYQTIINSLDTLTQSLLQDTQCLAQTIERWSQNHLNGQLLLVIDQIEELFLMNQDDLSNVDEASKNQSQLFLEAFRVAIDTAPQQLHIVAVLRSEFEFKFIDSPLSQYWRESRFPVRAMTSDELRQAIEGPALKLAIRFEPNEIIDRLIDEVSGIPDALPLLSFTLSELYIKLSERWRGNSSADRVLLMEDYTKLGGVIDAFTRQVTQEYEALDDQQKATVRRVMLRMVELIRGEPVPRRVPKSEFTYSAPEENQRVEEVLARFKTARLIKFEQVVGEPYAEPIHKVLFKWKKLNEWIWEEQENILLRQNLVAPHARDWEQSGRAETYLQGHNPRLLLIEEILRSDKNWFNKLETEFVKSSIIKYRKAYPVFTEPQLVKEGRGFVVVIGINEYKYFDRLNNAVNDALGIKKALEELEFTTPIPPILNGNATKEAIEALVEDQLPEVLRKDDNLILFFAGHGATQTKEIGDMSLEFGYLVPVNAKRHVWSSLIRVKWLLERVGELPAKHILVILDACRSGFALGEAKFTFRGDEGTQRYKQDLLRKRSRKVITSAQRDQDALDGGGPIPGNSLFTGYLINGLLRREADREGNGIITSSELGLWVQQTVAQETTSWQTPDFGVFHLDDRGDMVISLEKQVYEAFQTDINQ